MPGPVMGRCNQSRGTEGLVFGEQGKAHRVRSCKGLVLKVRASVVYYKIDGKALKDCKRVSEYQICLPKE